jgi:alkanesulfonate monooxygenase SsuD/methylene tetrahydromethanopterin reductase-like flavin-dependent oxidoreductase (luciferase family)
VADGLRFGLYGLLRGGGIEPDTLVRRARLAEEAGFESLWVGDHVALPADLDGEQPRLEVVVALSHLAAVTTRVRLGFGVIVLPQRQPVLLAKQLSSIDILAKGRLTVGIGVGYVEPELRAMGVSLADRGARTDEYLAVMRTLWTEPAPSFEGRFVSFAGSSSVPHQSSGHTRRSWSVGTRRPRSAARSPPETAGTACTWTWSRRRKRWPASARSPPDATARPASVSSRSPSPHPDGSTSRRRDATPTWACTAW